MAKKYVYVGVRDEIKIEVVSTFGGDKFLVMSAGHAQFVDEIKVGDIVYTVDEAKNKFSVFSLHSSILSVLSAVYDEEPTKSHCRFIAKENDRDLGHSIISTRAVAKVCRTLGFELERDVEGFVVVIRKETLDAAKERIEGS